MFLSAGTDSTVALESACFFPGSNQTAFCVGFHEKTFDERPGARETANMFGVELTDFTLEPNVIEFLPQIAGHEPLIHNAAKPQSTISN